MTPRLEHFTRDTATDRQVRDYAELRLARFRETHPGDPEAPLAEVMAGLKSPDRPGSTSRTILARQDDQAIGFGALDVDYDTNPQLAWVEVYVEAVHRRRGVGNSLLAALLDIADDMAATETGFGVALHTAVGLSLRERFEGTWGLPVRMVERIARLDLAGLDQAEVRRDLDARLARIGPRYRPIFFEMDNLPPAETGFDLDAFVNLIEVVDNLMPLEDLTMAPETFTKEKFYSQVERMRAQGRTIWNWLLVESDTGAHVGLTNVGFSPTDPRRISQWATGVIKPAQGQGLGKALKLLMADKLLTEVPGAQFIETENAASNDAMIAINTAMGFTERFRIHDYQLPIAELRRLTGLASARGK